MVTHLQLRNELERLGLSESEPPEDAARWWRFLNTVDATYGMAEEGFIYRSLFEQTGEAVFLVDFQRRLIRINPRVTELLGWTPDDLIGSSSESILEPEEIASARSNYEALIRGEELPTYERTFIHKDGGRIPMELSVRLIRDAGGEPLYILSVARDATRRKEAENAMRESEENFRKLFMAAEWRAQQLAILHQVRTAVTEHIELPVVMRAAVEAVAEVLDYEMVSLYLREGDVMHLQHQVGYRDVIRTIPITSGVSGRVARTGEAVLLRDVTSDPDFLAARPDIVSEVCVPLVVNGVVEGIFNVETSRPERFDEDDLQLVLTVCEYITLAMERARLYTALRQSKEQYETVVDNIRDVIFQADMSGRLTFMSGAWSSIGGIAPEATIGHSAYEFLHPDDRKKYRVQGKRLARGEISDLRIEARALMNDGNYREVEIYVRAIPVGQQPTGVIGMITDIGERKQAEQAALELAVEKRTVGALRGFLSGVSHDVRTPLSVMNTSLHLLKRKMENAPDATRHLDVLAEQVEHLSAMVEDMLDMSRLDDALTEFEFTLHDLNGLVRDVLVGLEVKVRLHDQQLHFEPEAHLPKAILDPLMIGRAIKNLVNNALSYTPDGGAITVRTRLREGHLLIVVEDTGSGIAPADMPYIFDRFYRADRARATEKGGMGLGLSIVKQIVERHGGWVEAVSVPGQGSRFSVWLPVRRQDTGS